MDDSSKKVVDFLNAALTNALLSLNQLFLHARVYHSWKISKLSEQEYNAALSAMRRADKITERILYLEGSPSFEPKAALKTGKDVQEVMQYDVELDKLTLKTLKDAIDFCEEEQDFDTSDLLQNIVQHTEKRVEWLNNQLGLIEKNGLDQYQKSAKS